MKRMVFLLILALVSAARGGWVEKWVGQDSVTIVYNSENRLCGPAMPEVKPTNRFQITISIGDSGELVVRKWAGHWELKDLTSRVGSSWGYGNFMPDTSVPPMVVGHYWGFVPDTLYGTTTLDPEPTLGKLWDGNHTDYPYKTRTWKDDAK